MTVISRLVVALENIAVELQFKREYYEYLDLEAALTDRYFSKGIEYDKNALSSCERLLKSSQDSNDN